MRKREFLKELSERLSFMSKEERDNVVQYYDELIEDTIDRTGKREEEVIYDLDSIDTIVRKVGQSQKDSSEKIIYDEDFTEDKSNEFPNDYEAPKKNSVDKNKKWIYALVVLITSPIWFSIIMTCVGIIVGIVCAGFGMGVCGVVLIVFGIMSLASSLTTALIEIGVGLILGGLALIVAPLIVKGLGLVIKGISQAISYGSKKVRSVMA